MSGPGIDRSTAETARATVMGLLQDCHVALPGQVQSYDGTKNQASVSVMVKLPTYDDDGEIDIYEDLGTLVGVPVSFYRAGGFYAAGPVVAGDEGVLLFASTAIGEWLATGEKSRPQDARRMSVGYPWFLPCAWNNTRALPDISERASGLVIGKEGGTEQLLVQPGLIQAGNATSGAAAVSLSAKTDAALQALETFCIAVNTLCSNLIPASGCTAGQVAALATALTALQTAFGLDVPTGTLLFKAK